MLNNTLYAAGLLLCGALRLTLVASFLIFIPFTCMMLVKVYCEDVSISFNGLP